MRVFYLYNHDISECGEAPYQRIEIYKDTYYCQGKGKVTMVRYCEHCNSILVGHWEYIKNAIDSFIYDRYLRESKEGKPEVLCNKFGTRQINERHIAGYDCSESDVRDLCYNCERVASLEKGDVVNTFVFDEKKYQTIEPYYKFSPEVFQYRKEIESFGTMEVCPICNEKLVNNKDNFWSNAELGSFRAGEKYVAYNRWNNDSVLEDFNAFKTRKLSDFSKENATQKVEKKKEEFDIKPVDKAFDKNAFDTDGLKNYLDHLCKLESNVFSICERLKELYTLHFTSPKDSLASQLGLTIELREKLTINKTAYSALEMSIPEKSIPVEAYAVSYPPAPVPPQMPQQPQLISVGLFNKNKAEEENRLLMQRYQADVLAYNAQVEIYTKEAERYNRIVEQLWQKQNEIYAQKVAEARKNKQDKLESLSKEINILEGKINEIKNGSSEIITTEKIENEFIESEIKEAENALCETYKALNELYSYNIIFGKYRNFVAVSTFYEYLVSGRCISLEGPDGAYNLYENEVRANQIISQLSQVIVSLEKIQQNQYVIYSAIKEGNRQLKHLNESMTSAVSSLKKISCSMESIAENTAITAYNSTVTAYYSKKNTELTNALGFMLALS